MDVCGVCGNFFLCIYVYYMYYMYYVYFNYGVNFRLRFFFKVIIVISLGFYSWVIFLVFILFDIVVYIDLVYDR